jgi:hypothetical protein
MKEARKDAVVSGEGRSRFACVSLISVKALM